MYQVKDDLALFEDCISSTERRILELEHILTHGTFLDGTMTKVPKQCFEEYYEHTTKYREELERLKEKKSLALFPSKRCFRPLEI